MRKLVLLAWLALASLSCFAQNGNNYARGFVYIGVLASIPSKCSVGTISFITDATAGQNIYECASANTWTQQSGGAGGGFTAPAGWQVNPLGNQGNWATAGNWSLDNTVTLTADTTGTASLWNGTGTFTPASGHDMKINAYTTNITGRAASGDTWSDFYHITNYNLNNAADTVGHALAYVFTVSGTSTAGSTIQQLSSIYATMGATNLNGHTLALRIGDAQWNAMSGTGTIDELDTWNLAAPPAITGGPTVTAASVLNLGDASVAAMPGTSKSSLAVGGIVFGKKAMVTITASNGAGLDNMLIVGSGAPSQIKGGLVVSAAVNTVASLFSGEDANDTFGVVVNGQNSFHFSYDGTGAFEWGVSTGAGSDFVLRSPGRSVNNIRINRTTGVLTWNDYKSSSGTRFLCVDSSGVMTASASACSGT